MGMFDYVRSEIALPDGFAGELQTKDLDCDMTVALIRADGRLLIEDSEWEAVPKAERPYPDAPDGSIEALAGSMRTVNRRWRDLQYHGDLSFYGYEQGKPGAHEYKARFTDGQLVRIEQVSAHDH